MPVAVEVIDEPREYPNPWNRNLKDTITYSKMMKEAGLTRFISPMGDVNNNVDYSGPLSANTDIMATHATHHSKKLIDIALTKKSDLWFYNTGMDRYSWGFYNWRMGSQGRWEWHFRWRAGSTSGSYLGDEYHNPFTKSVVHAPEAPFTEQYPGAMVFGSSFFS